MFDIRKIQEQVIFRAVKDSSNEDVASKIVYGSEDQARDEDNALWVASTMRRLEAQFNKAEVKKIRMGCQCGYGMDEKLKLLEELLKSASTLEEFANQDKARAAGLYYADGQLYLQFHFCPCPMLAEVDRLETDSWCQCTTGYSKVLFEKAFACEVEVELLKSIKMGDERCLMKIIPKEKFIK